MDALRRMAQAVVRSDTATIDDLWLRFRRQGGGVQRCEFEAFIFDMLAMDDYDQYILEVVLVDVQGR